MKRMLLVIDPQYDFITGTLPVPNAQKAMDQLATYIFEHAEQYECIAISADWHPWDHASFAEQGGPWPRHCVQFSHGASIYQPLLEAAHRSSRPVHVLTKGTTKDREEYSVFQNFDSNRELEYIISVNKIERIDLCGLAGDVCVLDSLRDGIKLYGPKAMNVLQQFSPSIDGGEKLNAAVETLTTYQL